MRKAGLIDAELLAKCLKAGECDCEGLQRFLKENGGKACLADLKSLCKTGGRGGITRGPGEAPLTWGKPGSQEQVKFKEEVLPPGQLASLKGSPTNLPSDKPAHLSSTTSPALPPRRGRLRGADAGSGSANTENVLPRHRAAVERYFERK